MRTINLPDCNKKEEFINSFSHGLGAVFSVFGLVLLFLKAKYVSFVAAIGSFIYGVSLILLYTNSCIYHALILPNKKWVFRIIDHCSVFLLEAGTYTPIILLSFDKMFSLILILIVCGIFIGASILNIIDVDKYDSICVFLNLVMGWGVLVLCPILINFCGILGIFLLIFGGVMYSVGSILYKIGSKRRYFHSIFHFFVLLGSVMHFIMIYYCFL